MMGCIIKNTFLHFCLHERRKNHFIYVKSAVSAYMSGAESGLLFGCVVHRYATP